MDTPPVKKDDYLETTIKSLTHDGRGICRINGYVIFVQDALPGEKCKIKVQKVSKKYGEAQLCSILTPSPERIQNHKPEPGLSLGHLSYEGQLKFKQQTVENALQRIANAQAISIKEIIPAPQTTHYRNKAIFHANIDHNNKPTLGFYQEKSHNIIPAEEYSLLDPTINRLYQFLRNAQQTEESLLSMRALLIRAASSGCMVCFALHKPEKLPEHLLTALQKNGATSISQVIAPPKQKISWKKTTALFGPTYITHQLNGLSFQLTPDSFFQVNHTQAAKLFETALQMAKIEKKHTIADIYCGTGALTLLAAKQAYSAIGIDIARAAIQDAQKNATQNKIDNATFHQAAAEAILPQLKQEKLFSPDIIFLDPPRQGCDPKVLQITSVANPQRVIYISCNPATLARDIALLAQNGYKLETVQPIDMFPNTYHVETICSLCGY